MPTIYMRKATMDDFDRVSEIITLAKKTLKDRGVDQWQKGYPDAAVLKQDIEEGINYLLIADGEIVATSALTQGIDENYTVIEDGTWMEDSLPEYSVIHRIAVDANHAGNNYGDTMIHHLLTISVELGYTDVRIDTHYENKGMQYVIKKNGFEYRGTIRMHDDRQPRAAFQMILK